MSNVRPMVLVRCRFAIILTLLTAITSDARAQFGLATSGVGPINRSMGGAAVAAPLDAAGAIYWNPATIGELGQSEMEVGAGFLVPRTTVSSRLGAGSLGPGLPPTALRGNTGGNNGVSLIPVVGLVYNPKESPWSYGLGIFEIGGFGVNYPVSPVKFPDKCHSFCPAICHPRWLTRLGFYRRCREKSNRQSMRGCNYWWRGDTARLQVRAGSRTMPGLL